MRQSLWRRPLGLLLLSALLVCTFSGAEQAEADGGRHPYFNDKGTLRWHHSLAAAKRAAKAEGKLIFVEYGRLRCSNCKKLAELVLPHPYVRSRMQNVAVGLAAECDTPEYEVQRLFRQHLPRARRLPFVAFLTPEGQWITGWSGRKYVNQFTSYLATAEQRHAQLMRARTPRRAEEAAQPTRRPAAHSPAAPNRAATNPAKRPATKPVAPCTPPVPLPEEQCDDEYDPCADGSCDAPMAANTGIPNLFKTGCDPCKPRTKPTPTRPVADIGSPGIGSPDGDAAPSGFPQASKRVEAPERKLAAGIGSPDGDAPQADAFPAPAVQPRLPQPAVKRSTASTTTPKPQPRTVTVPRGANPTTIAAATTAADRGDWATVLQLTRGMPKDTQPALYELNRQAHAWAHKQLAAAVRSIRARRYAEAQDTVVAVQTAMRGEPEAIDAERGAEAIELMQDIDPLAAESLVRRTVRKTAYEKMRGTRWAPLFSPVPQPGAAVATK